MRVSAFLLAMAICLLISFAVKAEVNFRYRRVEAVDRLDVDLRAFKGLWRFQYQIPSVKLEWEEDAGPQVNVEKVAEAAGGKRRETQKMRPRYIRRGWLSVFWSKFPSILLEIRRLKQQFYRGIRCKKIDWRVEVGCADAAQTGLMVGAFWSAMGFALSHLYRQVRVETKTPVVIVVPQFEKTGFSCDIQCIFHLRIGHIILIGFKALRRIRQGVRG